MKLSVETMFHRFFGTELLTREGLTFGFCVSFSGILTFKPAKVVQRVAKVVPADWVLIETDASFLAPMPMRCMRNEPASVAQT